MLSRVFLLLACAAAFGADTDKDVAELLDGVAKVASPGVPGYVVVSGEKAIPVVAGKVEGDRLAAAIAAARWGHGRVVAFSHNGYAGAEAAKEHDTGRLLRNAVVWAAAGRKGRPGSVHVVVRGGGLAEFLTAEGFDVRSLDAKRWTDDLAGNQVLCLFDSALDDADVAAVSKWVQGGGGLVTGLCPWGWMQVSGQDLLQCPLQRLLLPTGLCFADGTIDRTASDGLLAGDAPSPLLHAGKAFDALIAHDAGKRALSEGDLAQVTTTLTCAARQLPSTDEVLLRMRAAMQARAKLLAPTPETPLGRDRPLDRVLLALQVVDARHAPPDRVRAHPSAAAFPGAVPARAPRVARTVEIDTSVPGWRSLGLYAAPGGPVVLDAPKPAIEIGLSLRIGCHADALWHMDSWPRVPEVTLSVPIDSARIEVASPFGGLVYVEVPDREGIGRVELRISGVVEAPLFELGKTKPEEWRKSIRARPGPWAELATSKVIVTVPSIEVRDLDDPTAVLEAWDRVLDAAADLAAIPNERRRPERYVADVEISAGYMHSGYPIMTHLDAAPSMARVELLRKGSWGLFHELGHNHQRPEWTFEGTGEVTCNLFSMYISETVCGLEPAQAHDALADRSGRAREYFQEPASLARWQADPFTALLIYVQVQEGFGWEAYKKVFAEYAALPDGERPKSDDEKRDQWLERLSRTVGKDLGPLFEAWGIRVSARARESTKGLPSWMPKGFPPKK